jgi:hypothetical protein
VRIDSSQPPKERLIDTLTTTSSRLLLNPSAKVSYCGISRFDIALEFEPLTVRRSYSTLLHPAVGWRHPSPDDPQMLQYWCYRLSNASMRRPRRSFAFTFTSELSPFELTALVADLINDEAERERGREAQEPVRVSIAFFLRHASLVLHAEKVD